MKNHRKQCFEVNLIFSDGGSYIYQDAYGLCKRIKSGDRITFRKNQTLMFYNLPEDVTYYVIRNDCRNNKISSSSSYKKQKHISMRILELVLSSFLSIVLCFVVFIKMNQGNRIPTLAGFSMFHVLTSSMEKEIPKGSFVLTKSIDPNQLKIGDDITFLINQNTTITHRIVGIEESYLDTNQRAFETKGINNVDKDENLVPAVNVVGKVIFHSLLLGKAIAWLNEYWVFISIWIVVIFIIKIYSKKFILKKK